MNSWQSPTADELRRLGIYASRAEARAYFFDRLENPRWIQPLSDNGYFLRAPEAQPADTPGYVWFPPWPEGRYLRRMAHHDPDAVASVLKQVPPVDNPFAAQEVARCLLELPVERVVDLVPVLASWLARLAQIDLVAEEVTEIVSMLLEARRIDEGLSLLLVLLGPSPRNPPSDQDEEVGGPGPETHASQWEFERSLAALVDPIVAAGDLAAIAALTALCEVFDHLRPVGGFNDDLSFVWRPSIGPSDQNAGRGAIDALIDAIRDVALGISSNEAITTAVGDQLSGWSQIGRRIALYTVANSSEALSEATVEMVRRSSFEDPGLRHEYSLLLTRWFGRVSDGAQRTVLEWIDAGPDREAFRQRIQDIEGRAPTEDEVEGFVESWQRDWLSFVADDLDPLNKRRFSELVERRGEPSNARFIAWTSTGWGTQSPRSPEELAELSDDQIKELLRTWRPSNASHFGPTIEGLADALSSAAQQSPGRFASLDVDVAALEPAYVRGLLGGLSAALRGEGSFQWAEPIKWCQVVANKPYELDIENTSFDREPGWRWARREVTSLLQLGFSSKSCPIPAELRPEVWTIIDRLVSDPNPSPSYESRFGGDNMDPVTLSLNSNRATALSNVIEYSRWVARVGKFAGFAASPEAAAVLEAHLAPETDPSLAVRAVYGRWLPWLVSLDGAWAAAVLRSIFPADEVHRDLRDVAWWSYVTTCSPYDNVFRVLEPEYRRAVAEMPNRGYGRSGDQSSDLRMGEHLLAYYARGLNDDLLFDFVERAEAGVVADALATIGLALEDSSEPLDDQVSNRIRVLWTRVLDLKRLEAPSDSAIAAAFGPTFATGKLGADWSLSSLERAVASGGVPRQGHRVVERLVEAASRQPERVGRVMIKMLEESDASWLHHSWRDGARQIAFLCAQQGGMARTVAEDLVEFYARKGDSDFRKVLLQED